MRNIWGLTTVSTKSAVLEAWITRNRRFPIPHLTSLPYLPWGQHFYFWFSNVILWFIGQIFVWLVSHMAETGPLYTSSIFVNFFLICQRLPAHDGASAPQTVVCHCSQVPSFAILWLLLLPTLVALWGSHLGQKQMQAMECVMKTGIRTISIK